MEKVYIKGDRNINSDEIIVALHDIGIDTIYRFTDPETIYWIEDRRIYCAPVDSDLYRGIVLIYKCISIDEFINLIKNSSWYLNLKVGDIVTICDRKGSDTDYPFCFTKDMVEYKHPNFEIETIIENYVPTYEYRKKYYNGDNRMYKLSGNSYSWHSSMFIPNMNLEPVKLIELTDMEDIICYTHE